MKLTNKHKEIIMDGNSGPLKINREKFKEIKLAVRGHYWNFKDDEVYHSFSPTGREFIFGYDENCLTYNNKLDKFRAKLAAKYWAQGKYKLSRKFDNLYIENADINITSEKQFIKYLKLKAFW